MRALPLLVFPLALSLLAIAAAPARAICKAPHATLFPIADVVPPNPVLFRFEPEGGIPAPPIVVLGPDGPVKVAVADTATSAGLRVTAIQVELDHGWFTVEAGKGEVPRRFEIRDLPPPPAIGSEEEQLEWEDSKWTCSYTRALHMKMRGPGVVAFRAHWSDGHDELVPPDQHALFWGAYNQSADVLDPADAHVFLGHANCASDFIDPAYVGRRDVELYAMYADGMEQQIGQQVIASSCAITTTGGRPSHQYGPYPRQPSRFPHRYDRQIPEPAKTPAVAAPSVPAAPAKAAGASSCCASSGALPWIAGGAAAAGAVAASVWLVLRRRRRVSAVVP